MKKVLIVDDSEIIIQMLQKGFERYQSHFRPIFAMSGLEAMAILNVQSISLVVTDIQMPMIDGLVLLAFIRERFPEMPCMIMSAYGSDVLKEEVKNQVIHFLDKPVKVDVVAQLIISVLNETKPFQKDQMRISDFLNTIIHGRKTCIFKIIPEQGPSGIYYFNNGDLYNVVCGKLKGEEAALKALKYENAKIIFTKPPEQPGQKSVNIDTLKFIGHAKSSSLSIAVDKSSASGMGHRG